MDLGFGGERLHRLLSATLAIEDNGPELAFALLAPDRVELAGVKHLPGVLMLVIAMGTVQRQC